MDTMKVLFVGASLSEPHTSEKFGTVVTYTNNYEKKRTISLTTTGKSERFPYLIDTIVHVAKDNKYSLLTLFTICLDVHVAKNNKCNLSVIHIWLVQLLASRKITT